VEAIEVKISEDVWPDIENATMIQEWMRETDRMPIRTIIFSGPNQTEKINTDFSKYRAKARHFDMTHPTAIVPDQIS
jgi:hypothetical protein